MQDGQLAPAYFFPNYENFKQLSRTVEKWEYCFESSFQGFPQTSIPPLIAAVAGIMDLPGFRSKVLNTRHFSESPFENLKFSYEILIVGIYPVLLEKMRGLKKTATKGRNFAHSSQRDYEGKEQISEYMIRVNLYTNEIVHRDLVEKKPVGSFGEMSCNIRKNHKHVEVLEFWANQLSCWEQ